jgi:hypothetical protein
MFRYRSIMTRGGALLTVTILPGLRLTKEVESIWKTIDDKAVKDLVVTHLLRCHSLEL